MPSMPRWSDIRRNATLKAALGALAGCLLSACATFTGADPGARSPGVILDDRGIERAVKVALRDAGDALAAINVGVDSFNGVVLLTGQVPDAALKREAQRNVEPLRKVRRIHNELVVGPADTFVSRANDRLLEGRTLSALVGSENVNADRVKIVVRNGAVFLMGLVTNDQGDAAANVASRVSGVQRVVKVFEYIEPPAPNDEDAEDEAK